MTAADRVIELHLGDWRLFVDTGPADALRFNLRRVQAPAGGPVPRRSAVLSRANVEALADALDTWLDETDPEPARRGTIAPPRTPEALADQLRAQSFSPGTVVARGHGDPDRFRWPDAPQ